MGDTYCWVRRYPLDWLRGRVHQSDELDALLKRVRVMNCLCDAPVGALRVNQSNPPPSSSPTR